LAAVQSSCASKANCAGFVKRSWGDYWLLSDVTHRTPSTGAACYKK
jgi:hypothetical protein